MAVGCVTEKKSLQTSSVSCVKASPSSALRVATILQCLRNIPSPALWQAQSVALDGNVPRSAALSVPASVSERWETSALGVILERK